MKRDEFCRLPLKRNVKSGQAIIEFAISCAFIIVFAFMASRIAQWFVVCLVQRNSSFAGTRLPAGSSSPGQPFDAPSATVDLIN
jgi:hypothetical protein